MCCRQEVKGRPWGRPEATSAKQGLDGDEATGFTNRDVSDVAVGGVGNAQHVPGTAHLETFQKAHVNELRGPGL